MANKVDWLHPRDVRKLSNKELRSYYSRARAAANKRIKRLEKVGLRSDTARGAFPKIKGLSTGELERELADVSRFLRSERTTVTGERAFISNEITSLRKQGYDFVNQSNIYDFIKFMDEKREEVGSRYFDSGDAADVFNQGQRLNVPTDVLSKHFDYFLENMDKMENVQPIKTDRAITFSDIKRKMNRL